MLKNIHHLTVSFLPNLILVYDSYIPAHIPALSLPHLHLPHLTFSQLQLKNFSTRVEVFGWIFVRNAVIAVNSVKKLPFFTAFPTKIHHRIRHISYKSSPH